MSRSYVILTEAEAGGQAANAIDFDSVFETSAASLRWSNADPPTTFVKFEGDTPSWLEGKPTHTNAEMLAILNVVDGDWWVDPPS